MRPIPEQEQMHATDRQQRLEQLAGTRLATIPEWMHGATWDVLEGVRLFEVARKALEQVEGVQDPEAVATALAAAVIGQSDINVECDGSSSRRY